MLNAIAEFVWGEENGDPLASPQVCMDMIADLTLSMPCFKKLLAKMIGIAILAASCINKAPIIYNIVSNKSAAGLSTKAQYSELLVYANAALYGLMQGNPFTAYGETVIVSLQVAAITALVWKYQRINEREIIAALLAFGLYLALVVNVVPETYYFMLLSGNLPILVYSRGLMIVGNFTEKHTGAQSSGTHLMNFAGSLIRILTTIQEIGFDWAMLSGYIISVTLNVTLLTQTILYKENTNRYFQSLKKKKD